MTGLENPAPRRPTPLRRWLLLGVLAAGFALFFLFGLNRYVSFAAVRLHRSELLALVAAHPLGAGLGYALGYAAMVACSIPGGTVATVLSGFLFGPYFGTGYAVAGATLGATLLFLAARTTLGAALAAKAGPALQRMEAGFRANALSYLLVLRLVPLFPFWLVNLVPALLNVPLRTYVLGTVLGVIPATFVFALVGNGLGQALDAGSEPKLDILFRASVLAPLLALAALALVPVVYRLVARRRR